MYSGPKRIAHRGNVQRAPENTLEAVQAAFNGGFEGVEIDVRLTKDRRVVLAHDENLLRVTSGGPHDGRGWKYRERDWSEIKECALPYANHLLPPLPEEGITEDELYGSVEALQLGRDPHHPHEAERRVDPRIAHPVLFEIVLEWVVSQGSDFIVEVECKEPGLSAPLAELFGKVGGAEQCILFSGTREIIGEIADHFAPALRPTGLRIGANIRRLTTEWRRLLPEMHLDAVDLNAFEAGTGEVRELQRPGRLVLSNLGDLPTWWEQLAPLGFHGFKTNYPEDYTQWWMRWKDKAGSSG